ncbi:MAG: PEP-CTERM sorting domain-containing protein [Akkermansiaceae bacterium]
MKKILTISLTSLLVYQSASAVIVTFTDRTAWETAVNNAGLTFALEDFESIPLGTTITPTPLNLSSIGLTVSHPGTDTSAPNFDYTVLDGTSGNDDHAPNASNFLKIDDSPSENVTFTVNTGTVVRGFGFEYSGFGGNDEGLTSNLGNILVPVPEGANDFDTSTSSFFGFIDTDISNVYTFLATTADDGGYGIDNVVVATAVVPEPSAFALLGLGTLGLLSRRSRR